MSVTRGDERDSVRWDVGGGGMRPIGGGVRGGGVVIGMVVVRSS